MALTRKTKESLKTALAMVIAYGIALYMDWDKAYWAAYAVAFCSLATIGQSLNKAALRMVGTLMAVVVAFLLLGFFNQHRWLFILFLSLWIGFCTYGMGAPRHQYFWHVSGFVCAVVAIDAGPDPAKAFTLAAVRAQETGMGILVYSLVSIFVWPIRSGDGLKAAAVSLVASQRAVFEACVERLSGRNDALDDAAIMTNEAAARAGLAALLDAAETDDVEVRELRGQWRRFQWATSEFAETIERWREGFGEIQAVDLPGLLPALDDYHAEIDARLRQVENLLSDKPSERETRPIVLKPDRSETARLSSFQRAALTVGIDHMGRLDKLTRGVVSSVRGLTGDGVLVDSDAGSSATRKPLVVDPDRVAGGIRQMVAVWLAWLAYLYLDGLPAGTGLTTTIVPLGMALAAMPQLRVWQLARPFATGVLVGGAAYVLVMPHLTGFAGLSVLIFACTFWICQLNAEPRQMLGRAAGLAMFVVIAAIDNDQNYSVLSVIDTAVMLAMALILLGVASHIPLSPRPDRAILRLTRRFFRSYDHMLAAMGRRPDEKASWLEVRRMAFHRQEIATLPAKLAAWSKCLHPATSSDSSPQKAPALVASIRTLARAADALIDEREHPQSQILADALRGDIRSWRLAVQGILQKLARNASAGDTDALRRRLSEIMAHLEGRIAETLDTAPAGGISEQEAENFYRLLGAYRRVSEALIGYTGSASDIEWTYWHEERFA